jgi:hypothetical protein
MFWCCGSAANVEVPVPKEEKLSVNVAVVSKPITLMSRAPPVDQHIVVVPVKKEELSLCVDEVYAEPRRCVVKKSTLVNVTKGAVAVAALATVVYCLSNTDTAAILTPAYNDFF